MDQLAPFKPDEEAIQDWLERFEHWFRLVKKDGGEQADWCHLLMGKEADTSLHLVADEQSYSEVRATLIMKLGDAKPHETAARKLAALAKGTLTCHELAHQAKYLAKSAFQGAPDAIREQQALDAFLQALPVTLWREIVQVERRTLQEACDEAIRQEALTQAELEEGKMAKVVKEEDTAVMAVKPGTPAAPCTCGTRPCPPPASREPQACYECGQEGHFRRNCTQHKMKNKKPGVGKQPTWDELASFLQYLMSKTQLSPPRMQPPRPTPASPPAHPATPCHVSPASPT